MKHDCRKILLRLSVTALLAGLAMAPAFSVDTKSVDLSAYNVYKQANEMYKVQKFEEAKLLYKQLYVQYSDSKFAPYGLYMLSFLDTDYVKIIYYLDEIRSKYPHFRYWTNSVEKLGDIYYIMNNHTVAIDIYKLLSSDKAYYMLSQLYSANGFQQEAVDTVNKLMAQTKNYSLAYKGFMIQIKAYFEMSKLPEVFNLLNQAAKLKKWSDDNGVRLLFYAGRYYFQRSEVEKHYEKSLYAFSLLKANFPLSLEATMANNYVQFLSKNNILSFDRVAWLDTAYTSPVELAYKDQTITLDDDLETKAEDLVTEAENINAGMVKTEVVEYVIRVGEYKDLGVANLVVSDIAKTREQIPLGVYFRNDRYYPEIRGVRDINVAKQYAQKLMSMGYTDTKVIEVMKVVEFNK